MKGQIDIDEENILLFETAPTRSTTFRRGFFEHLRKSMSPGEINECFVCADKNADAGMRDFLRYRT